MDNMLSGPFIYVIVWVASLLILYLLLSNKGAVLKEKVKAGKKQNDLLAEELKQEKNITNDLKTEKGTLVAELAELNAHYKNLRFKYDKHVEDTQSMQERFEQLANKVLDEKANKFDVQHKTGIKEILDPLKEKIKNFEERIESNTKESISRHEALHHQLRSLKELNNKMTEEAVNLTKALKGDNKMQGNWGELILESILEKSGLEKDREYTVQDSFTTEEGKILRPDVIIHLPGDKKLVIDSKVSLKAYDKLISETEQEEQNIALKAHGLSIKTHIDGLSAKKYHDIYKMESPDFVLMFIPIDTAFSAALSHNPELYNYAFQKNIVIVTPSTLLATLKTVETIWQNEKQQRYALEIATEAGKMYDKFSAFVDDMVNIGKRIDQSHDTYQEAMKKLSLGRGNLVSKAEKIKQLGAKANKTIPKALVEMSEEAEE